MSNKLTTWIVESSHRVNVPTTLRAMSLKHLRDSIQSIANRRHIVQSRDYGQIEFRYELDEFDQACVVHAYYTNKHGLLSRFMRLRREDLNAVAA